ncbi:MAG: HEAT repeat domain-containing protein [Fuerstiella sp.]
MLRSADPMTYEDGYHLLQGDNLIRYVDQIAGILQSESDPEMRAKFVELVGDADLPKHIPLLVQELSHESREVRFWAYNQPSLSEHQAAKIQAEEFRQTHPGEDYY